MNLIYRQIIDAINNLTQRNSRYTFAIRLLMDGIPMSRIATLRKAVGLTQRELADAVSVTESTIRNWENNRSGLEMFIAVARLCQTLKCSPEDLVEFVQPEDAVSDP